MPSVAQRRILAKKLSEAVGFTKKKRSNTNGVGDLVYAWGTDRSGRRGGASVSPKGTTTIYLNNISRELDTDAVSMILDEVGKAKMVRHARGW